MHTPEKTISSPIVKKSDKNGLYIVEGFFPDDIVAGFTDSTVRGVMPEAGEQVASLIGKGIKTAYMDQVHGSLILNIDSAGEHMCDGIITRNSALLLIVRTADCMPIVLSDSKSGKIGAIHMGWRSAAEGILENIRFDMQSLKIFLGPGIRSCCYEVGEEFTSRASLAAFVEKRSQKYYFDPAKFIRSSFTERGIAEQNIFDSGICTICSGYDIFSYRREKTVSRTLSFIGRAQDGH